MSTAINALSKPDTVLLLDAAAADLHVDLSENRTDLADNTTYLSEANSARAARGAPREISIVVDIADGDSGVLAQLGNAVSYSWRVDMAGGGIRVAEGGVLLASAPLPSLDPEPGKYLISWCQHPEPGGTVRSELAVYSFVNLEWSHAQSSHFAGTMSATDTLTVGAGFGGATAFSGGLAAFHSLRIGHRHHSTAEAAEDYVGQTTPPTMTQVRRAPPLVPDRATLDLASDGSFAGPAHLWAGHAFERADRRLVSPLLNLRINDPIRITDDIAAAYPSWVRLAPGSATMRLLLPYLFYRPVPGKVNRARVRLFVRHEIEIGFTTAEVRYRLYSIAGLPVVGEPVGPLSYRHTAVATCSVAHGAAPGGEWLDLGDVALEVDDWGCTFLAVGVEFDTDSPLAGDTRVHIHVVMVEPFALAQGGGLDIVNP